MKQDTDSAHLATSFGSWFLGQRLTVYNKAKIHQFETLLAQLVVQLTRESSQMNDRLTH
jgi:hypothetical protein